MFSVMTIMTFSKKTCTYAIISPSFIRGFKTKKSALNSLYPKVRISTKDTTFGIVSLRACYSPEPLLKGSIMMKTLHHGLVYQRK